MNQELGEMHWKDGWLFKRLEDGSVRIRKVAPNGSNMPDRIAVIPANEWVSLIQHLSHEQTAESFQAAKAFHEGAAVGRLPALDALLKGWESDAERSRHEAALADDPCGSYAIRHRVRFQTYLTCVAELKDVVAGLRADPAQRQLLEEKDGE